MFKPTVDRLEYGAEMLPPEGFHFVRAVGTTYSLDFETLIAVLVPLALSGDVEDEELNSNPIAILQAIRKVIGKLVIFCEAGQIKVPSSNNGLAALLDEIVVQVALPRRGKNYPSFHPKTWLVEYKDGKGEHFWRFIVLSRNLTNDHSWDVAASFEGKKRTGNYGATKDLVPFFEYLRGRVYKGAGTGRQKDVVNDVILSLDGVSFFCGDPFREFDIFPMGIGGDATPVDIFKASEPFDDLVVISPFLTPGLIRKLNGAEGETRKRTRILISRPDAVGKLKPADADRFRKYILRKAETESGEPHDLHAKVYLRRHDSQTELWLGSANATDSGNNRNVEMMVCLHCRNRHLNADRLMADICGGSPDDDASPLEEVVDVSEYRSEETEEEKARCEAEEAIKEICRLKKMRGKVVREGEKYRLSLSFKEPFSRPGVTVRPVNSPGNRVVLSDRCDLEFPGLMDLVDLSTLFVFSVEYQAGKVLERVVKIPVDGIPESRDDAVMNRMVKDHSALLKYLAMLLSPNPSLALRRLNESKNLLSKGGGGVYEGLMPGLYEDMLVAAAESPERIQEVGQILEKIKSDDETLVKYSQMYRRFAEALGL